MIRSENPERSVGHQELEESDDLIHDLRYQIGRTVSDRPAAQGFACLYRLLK
jgi:hypothetical protein